ncbi:MAG: family 10 glycosylhydrolase [Candidatus Hydrogenedentes bacterium]|nr:family 10 glycosylhydrolase [Candidatus Hydrogenedentota bacterium]
MRGLSGMMTTAFAVLCAGAVCAAPASGGVPLPPAPPAPDYPLIDDFAYANDDAAGQAWQPMADTAGPSVVRLDGRNALRMPCNFAETDAQRAGWDRAVSLDLSTANGIRFRFYCPDPSPVSTFNVYFRSGAGWYGAIFTGAGDDGWSTVSVTKPDTWTEDKPSGWSAIDRIRFSGWRGASQNAEFYVADLGLITADAAVVLARGEYACHTATAEARNAAKFAAYMAACLDDLGVPYVAMSDLDLTPARLQQARLVVLPYSPKLPESAVDTLVAFIERGGKVLSFYTLDARLAAAMGIRPGRHVSQQHKGYYASIRPSETPIPGMPPVTGQNSWNAADTTPLPGRGRVAAYWFTNEGKNTGVPAVVVTDSGAHMTHVLLSDDTANKRLFLLSLLAHLFPECGRQSADWHVARAGAVGPYGSFDEAERAIRKAAERPEPKAWLDEASRLREAAASAAKDGGYFDAIRVASQAGEYVFRAYCAVQQPEPGEHRAFWCHNALGVDGMSWDEAIKILADNGFTAILPNMLWGGTAFYESDVLPVSPEVGERGDQIALCLAACKKYGVQCHVWKVNYNTGSRADEAFLAQLKQEGRTQVSFDGTPRDKWLCPSHPANRQLEIDAMVEVATKYDVDGIHFDYIRYPDQDHCFCPGCRKRFEQAIGHPVADWPAATRDDEAIAAQWLQFRRDQITAVVAGVDAVVRKQRPGVQISAAVFQNWVIHRDTVGQDWRLWCQKGYLDFVCPMDYTPHNDGFESLVKKQIEWAGAVPCYPGIGLSCWPNPTDTGKLIEQIGITRRLGTGGFTIFNYGVPQAAEVVPLCGLGITRGE